jgi:hypothetical protein
MRYNVLTEECSLIDYNIPDHVSQDMLLTQQIRDVLRNAHDNYEGAQSEIEIWKEVKMTAEDGGPNKYVRAFHHFDVHGQFFDWVHVKHGRNGGYVPALVLLLYQYQCIADEEQQQNHHHHALVWKALPASNNERKHETNISARWKMKLLDSGLPHLEIVELKDMEECIKVHPHWRCKPNCHLPSTPLVPGADKSMFVIEESYDRYSWILNYIDPERW